MLGPGSGCLSLELRCRWALPGLTVIAGVMLGLNGLACSRGASESDTTPSGESNADRVTEAVLFTDVAPDAGLDFIHFIGATGQYYFPEIMGSGCALFDYDNDGDLDIYVVQQAMLDPRMTPAQATPAFQGTGLPGNRLFRNDLEGGKLHFTDVTEAAGVGHAGCGMGCAVGDYDNDGHVDLYVTNFGSNVLYHNNGDGTFTDVTQEAGVDDLRWSMSASFADFNGDGRLDLFVTNYLRFTVATNQECRSPLGDRDYCHPKTYKPTGDALFIQRADGRFEDVSSVSGIDRATGNGLGVVCADFNGDGQVDIYVANDAMPNFLWINRCRPGRIAFEERGLLSGAGVNRDGLPEGSMGLAAQDVDDDSDVDLFVTHLRGETSTLYINDGTGHFQDATVEHGLSAPSLAFTGFGTCFFDYDHDTRLDLFCANGAVFALESQAGQAYPFRQANQLFHRTAAGHFEDVSSGAGPAIEVSQVSRGAAFGDVDNDGDVDVVVVNNNGPLQLLRNDVGTKRHWLSLRLEGTRSNRSAIGARAEVKLPDGRRLRRRVRCDGSYLSANDARIHFGLGDADSVMELSIYWPSGRVERWVDLPVDQEMQLREGDGEVSP